MNLIFILTRHGSPPLSFHCPSGPSFTFPNLPDSTTAMRDLSAEP